MLNTVLGAGGAMLYGLAGMTLAVVDPTSPVGQYLEWGSLGVVVLLVLIQARERQQMARAIESKDAALLESFKQFSEIGRDMAEAAKEMNRIAGQCHRMSSGA